MRKPIRYVKFTKAVVRHADIRDQNPSLGMICPGDSHQRNTNAPKFEDRSQEETEWQERCAREAAWKLAKNILKVKEKNKTAFFSCLRHQILKPEEREFVVDSGASMHMISKKELNSAEMDTLTTCSPTMVITANGEVQTSEVLSLGKLCDEHGYFVPIVVPGLSTSSSSSLPSSTSMTSPTVSSESVAGQERGDPCGTDPYPAAVSSKHVERQERGRPVLF